ncbi:cation:proton antiporter [Candidatus Berkelbacteria bacterium]|nr:cation:proton antiporter [Candidatus Berkelbacteria bacterium]
MPIFEQSIFLQIGVIVGVATVLGFLARLMRQPLILAYIAAGIVLGPFGLKLITNIASVQTLSSLGVAFLLFLVGLELDYRKIKEVTKPALIVGLGQVLLTGLAGYLILRVLNFAPTSSAYIALALTFSSTIIVVKLLSEKNELNSLSGRLTIGLLLVQDLIAIVALLILSGSLSPSILLKPDALLLATFKTVIFLILIFLFNRLLLAKIFHQLARSAEILFLASLSWMFILAGLAFLFGFSVEIGAFIAGVSLASLPYNLEIINRVKSLRDFFLTLFFVVLGVGLVFTGVFKVIPTIIYLSLFVIFGHALIVLILLGFLGFKKRISFLTALNSAQISEFSLILVALGLKLGHLNVLESSIVSFVALTLGRRSFLV